MTTQEFVLNQAKIFADVEIGDRAKFISHRSVDEWDTSAECFKNGLTKGLEIADEFGDWTLYNNWEKHSNGKWMNDYFLTIPTTSELLTIFLTEKYGNNG